MILCLIRNLFVNIHAGLFCSQRKRQYYCETQETPGLLAVCPNFLRYEVIRTGNVIGSLAIVAAVAGDGNWGFDGDAASRTAWFRLNWHPNAEERDPSVRGKLLPRTVSLGICTVRAAMPPDLRGGVPASDRGRPLLAVVDGPLMARQSLLACA
jgi:hypothetical protein